MPHHQTRTDFLVDRVQAQLAAQGAVVPALGLFQPRQVFGQQLFRLEGRPVDALQHGPVFVAAPVSSGYAEQLQRRDVFGVRHVRPLAQVHEAVVAVYRKRFGVGQALD